MRKYFTADLHLGHKNIIQYSNRPFKDMEHMNRILLTRINERTNPDDVLYHVGDFACYGKERGIEVNRIHPKNYVNDIHCKLLLLQGNHDKNNRIKPVGSGLILTLGKIGHVTMSHYPTISPECPRQFTIKNDILGIHICGHVHNLWKYYYDKERNILNINVGIDMWKYNIISEDELINYIIQVKHELNI